MVNEEKNKLAEEVLLDFLNDKLSLNEIQLRLSVSPSGKYILLWNAFLRLKDKGKIIILKED